MRQAAKSTRNSILASDDGSKCPQVYLTIARIAWQQNHQMATLLSKRNPIVRSHLGVRVVPGQGKRVFLKQPAQFSEKLDSLQLQQFHSDIAGQHRHMHRQLNPDSKAMSNRRLQ
eukprot:4435922-Karenia_brevis.AAC.1